MVVADVDGDSVGKGGKGLLLCLAGEGTAGGGGGAAAAGGECDPLTPL